jgi:DNA repair exonuclease SbcCD ATPase subunit
MLQQDKRCEVVRGYVDTTEEESIDRELIGRRASDGLYSNLNKAAVIGGVGALPVIGAAAAVAVKQNVHDVLQEQYYSAVVQELAATVAAQGHELSIREKQLGGLLEGNAELTARVAAQNQDKEEATKQHAEELDKLTQAKQQHEQELEKLGKEDLAKLVEGHERTLRDQKEEAEQELKNLREQLAKLHNAVAAQGHELSIREKQLGGLLEGNAELTARVAAQNQDKEEATTQQLAKVAGLEDKLTQAIQQHEDAMRMLGRYSELVAKYRGQKEGAKQELKNLREANEKQLAAQENAQKAHEDTLLMQIKSLEAELRIEKEPVETVVVFPGVPGNGSRVTGQDGGKAQSWWQHGGASLMLAQGTPAVLDAHNRILTKPV